MAIISKIIVVYNIIYIFFCHAVVMVFRRPPCMHILGIETESISLVLNSQLASSHSRNKALISFSVPNSKIMHILANGPHFAISAPF